MKILFFTYDFPYPTNSGGKMRAFNMMKYAKKGNEIILFSFVRDGFDTSNIAKLREIGIDKVEVFPRKKVKSIQNLPFLFKNKSFFNQLYYDAAVAKRLEEVVLEEKISIIHLESFYTACFASPVFTEKGVKQIYGSENIEYKLYEEYVSQNIPLLVRPFFIPQINMIKAEELQYVRQCDMTLAVTESEKSFFSTHTDHPVHVIENGVSVDEFVFQERKKEKTFTALFVGNFSYFPNKAAVEFFYTNVMKKYGEGDLRFRIIGKGSSQFQSFKDDRVETVEFIDDIKEAYYNADVFICPIAIGGGTNFKILEAMATGLPVIAFSDRVKEIGARDERDVLTADSGEDFLKAVEKLRADHALGIQLAGNARKIIEEKYAWEAIGRRLTAAWKEIHESH